MSSGKILVVASDLVLLKRARMSFADTSSDIFTANDVATASKILNSNAYNFQHLYIQDSLTTEEKKEIIWLAHQHKMQVNEISIDKTGQFLIN